MNKIYTVIEIYSILIILFFWLPPQRQTAPFQVSRIQLRCSTSGPLAHLHSVRSGSCRPWTFLSGSDLAVVLPWEDVTHVSQNWWVWSLNLS